MIETLVPSSVGWTAADIVEHFGPIPIWRIRRDPPPGEATEEDVLEIHAREKRLCELVDGVLVEKTVGTYQSLLAGVLFRLLANFVAQHKLGIALPPDGMLRLAPELVRIPDICFISWTRIPNREALHESIASLAPDLAIEVISPSNTKKEMQRKLTDYFGAGVRLVWYVYPESREVHVFISPTECTVLTEKETLSGGEVLPGFRVALAEVFAEPNAPQK